MGYEHIQSMAERIETTVNDVISGDDRLTRETLIFLNDSISSCRTGCENLREGSDKLRRQRRTKSRDAA